MYGIHELLPNLKDNTFSGECVHMFCFVSFSNTTGLQADFPVSKLWYIKVEYMTTIPCTNLS